MRVTIMDSAFGAYTKSASLREANKEVYPTYFKWAQLTYGGEHDTESAWFYTDWFAAHKDRKRGVDFPENKTIVAWLLEPRHLRPENYERIEKNHKEFDVILTYDRALILSVPNATFYPFGGSSIALANWHVYPKTKKVCMILSDKKTMVGHQIRHRVATHHSDKVDLYGGGVGKPFDRTVDVLKDYKYCIVVESGRTDAYFSEKLIDAISVGCVPIYWGCPTIHEFFDPSGMVIVENQWALDAIINRMQNIDGEIPQMYLQRNLEQAKKYRIVEDWIWNTYPELFGKEQK